MLGVAASIVRYEEKQIFSALDRRGIPYVRLDARLHCSRLTGSVAPGLRALLNREVAQTRGIYLAYLLEAAGVMVVNTAAASEVCADKVRCTLALAGAGIATPQTLVALGPEAARKAVRDLGLPVVAKPVQGSWGRLVTLLRDADAVDAMLEYREAMAPQQRIYYLQEFVDKPGRDIRVVVAGGRALGAVYRRAASWRTNSAQGGVSEPCELTPDIATTAVAAASAVGAELAGVDLMESRDGRLLALEVNHLFEFQAFEAAHGGTVRVGEAIVDHLVSRCL